MFTLLLKVAAISASGALAPGPLTTAVALAGIKRGWRAGLEASLGHTIIELPIVLLISAGVAAVFTNTRANIIIGIIGSLFLLFFGFSTVWEALKNRKPSAANPNKVMSPFVTGMVLSALNPYFIAWWVGVGTPIISEAMHKVGYAGIGLVYLSHVWLDYVWLTFIAALVSMGSGKVKFLRWVLVALGLLVGYFGISMLIKTVRAI